MIIDILHNLMFAFWSFKNNIRIMQAPESKHPWTLVWWSLTSTACVPRTLASTPARQSTSTERRRQLPASKCRVSKLFYDEWRGSKTWQKILSSVMCSHELQDSSICAPCVSSQWRPPEHLFAPHCTRQDPTLRSSTRQHSAGNCTHFWESNLHSTPQQPWGSWEG